MLKRFLPRQEGFFNLFQKTADIMVSATTRFYAMLHDLAHQQQHVDAIAEYEKEADKIALTTFELLHKTFITPFDRHDIHQLTSRLDDVLDLLNRSAQRFPFYDLQSVPEEMVKLSELSVQASKLVRNAIYQLHSLKKSTDIIQFCNQTDQVESKAHIIVLSGEKSLFTQENDFKHFIKLKEIYAQTKAVINCCQDVGNIIRGIVLEYS